VEEDPEREAWARAKRLFQEALDVDAERRSAFLEERCAEDAALKDAVELLLAAHDEAQAFLESPTEADRLAAELLDEPAQTVAVGSRIGPYDIVGLLGAGGMGEVYRARDERLGRDVAVKVLRRSDDPDPRRRQRFAREARAVGSINDPSIVTVFDVGWHQGTPYLVSELLEGETLGERLRRGRLGPRESVACAVQIARSLAAAHDKGVAHLDLKPENVFLTRQGAVKLLDFGVARFVESHPERRLLDSGSGPAGGSTLVGTPGYMAPEQMEGRADHRADLFALGAVLYRMLTGRHALPGSTSARDPSPADGAGTTRGPSPPPFSAADAVPAALERIVRRCLETRPEDRFQSAAEVRLALERLAEAEPRLARRRVPITRLAAGALVSVLLLGAVPQRGSRVAAPPTTRVRSLAVLPFRGEAEAAGQDYLVEGVTDGLTGDIARLNLDGVRLIARGSVMPFKAEDLPLPEVARRLGVDAVVQGTVTRTGRRVGLRVRLVGARSGEPLWAGTYEGRLDEAADLQRRIVTGVAAVVAPEVDVDRNLPRRRPPRTVEAYEAYLRGRYYWNARSEDAVRKAIEEFNRALALDPLYAPAYTGLADAFATLGDVLYLLPSHEAFAQSEAASLRALRLDPSQAEAHATLGHLRMHAWRWVEAEREFQQALEIDGDYASAHQWRAWNLMCTGRPDEGVASIQTARRVDPLSPSINADVAQILYFARRHDEAVAQSRQTLQMYPGFQEARRVLFLALLASGREREALEELETFYRSPDGGPGASAGYAFALLGRRGRAVSILRQQEARSQRQFVPPFDRAVIHVGLGNLDRAFALLEESVKANDTESMILPADPRLDPLRGDPRFAALLRGMGLPHR
jgi:serine/threonine-protein kinase